jgi:putative hemolysin
MIGIVYLKDIFFYDGNPETFKLSDLIRKPYFTYELKKTAELFTDLKKHHMPMAIVLDEYGGTAGIVTIEDLVEEIVGELRDEYDDSEIEIEALKNNEYLVDGRTKIDVVNETLEIQLPEDEFDTIGGFVTGALGRMGKIGDSLDVHGVNFRIIKMHKNRIMLLKIRT